MNITKKHAMRESGICNLLQINHLRFWEARKTGSNGFPAGSSGFPARSRGFRSRWGGFPTGSNTFQMSPFILSDPQKTLGVTTGSTAGGVHQPRLKFVWSRLTVRTFADRVMNRLPILVIEAA